MELSNYFKSVLEQDVASVVICDLQHTIIYMNPAAIGHYHSDYTGKSIKACHNEKSCEIIDKVVDWFADSKQHNIIHTFYNVKENKDVYMVALRDDKNNLIGYYEKHEYRTVDKTPLYQF